MTHLIDTLSYQLLKQNHDKAFSILDDILNNIEIYDFHYFSILSIVMDIGIEKKNIKLLDLISHPYFDSSLEINFEEKKELLTEKIIHYGSYDFIETLIYHDLTSMDYITEALLNDFNLDLYHYIESHPTLKFNQDLIENKIACVFQYEDSIVLIEQIFSTLDVNEKVVQKCFRQALQHNNITGIDYLLKKHTLFMHLVMEKWLDYIENDINPYSDSDLIAWMITDEKTPQLIDFMIHQFRNKFEINDFDNLCTYFLKPFLYDKEENKQWLFELLDKLDLNNLVSKKILNHISSIEIDLFSHFTEDYEKRKLERHINSNKEAKKIKI